MERREEPYESRKTISIEEYLLKRKEKQEKNSCGKNKAKEDSPVHIWAELYI